MATPFESASLNLQLFDLRREAVLREARAWFLSDFNPLSVQDFMTLATGDRSASVRMVLGYWDMAASMVTTGAIDGDAFRAAHSEVTATFAKVYPILKDLRSAMGRQDYCQHLEAVVLAAPGAEAALARIAEGIRAAVLARTSA